MSHGRTPSIRYITSRMTAAVRRIPPLFALIPAIALLASASSAAGSAAAGATAASSTPASSFAIAATATPDGIEMPSLVLCSGYARCERDGFDSYGYGGRRNVSYWHMSAGDECTNYVAFVEATAFGAPDPRYLLGNAGQWPRNAAAHGMLVNNVPSVGAVAVWNGDAYGIGPDGHVAVVEKVGPHDSYIVISQQHLLAETNGYDWTRINAGFPAESWQSWPSHFIHFPISRR